MNRGNKTFRRGEPTWANACVGNNGFPGYWEYSKGFSSAATFLIDAVLRDGARTLSVDEFVYPVCFNMRHSVELRLKAAAAEIKSIAKIKGGDLAFDFLGSHDIGKIWQHFRENSESIDDRYGTINNGIDGAIRDIAEIDATGQTFRYPFDTESQKHLTNVSLINFLNLREQFKALEEGLDTLHRLNGFLADEYSFKTFTKHLSRKQLFMIAGRLPPYSGWKHDNFRETKEYLKSLYSISSNELSKAINFIKGNFELAPIIDIQLPLLGLADEDITRFLRFWSKIHDLKRYDREAEITERVIDFSDFMGELSRDTEIKREIWETERKVITPEALAGITALYYFARELDFSERYLQLYGIHKKEAEYDLQYPVRGMNSYFHILDKTNGMENILQSLYFLRKQSLAEQVIESHSLGEVFDWLDGARSRELFSKPQYCGYTI